MNDSDLHDKNLIEQHFRRAMQKLEEARLELADLKKSLHSPIAVVGMSCRFPDGANSIELFWQKLLTGVPLIKEIPATRWKKEKYYSKDRQAPGKMYSTKAGFIDDIDLFDASFFGISRREAQLMDPQQRILLEETWQAFEVAGIDVNALKGSNTGVFIGCGSHDYINHLTHDFSKDSINAYFGTGNSSSVIAGRIAYCFGFQGPAFTLDTACSSSLVAIHEACMALRQQECSVAVAGGVNAILTPDVMINFCKANMLSEDGLCKTFDSRADGYVRGEGVGVVILKRLDDAIANNDNILACIIGDGINQDGASSSLTSPNGDAQEKLIRETLAKFKISPSSIDYVEAHGTGTALGDPIEINALNAVFGGTHTVDDPLYIGSVKTNIGHLEAGAGVAGVIKVILSLLNEKIPAHLNFNQFNPLIDHRKIPLAVPVQATDWRRADRARRASVSSFGFSGTNGYLVLEEYSENTKEQAKVERDYHPFILSAKSQKALQSRVNAMQSFIEATETESITDICYTLNTGRVHFNHQIFISCADKNDLIQKLQESKKYYDLIQSERDSLLMIRLGMLTEHNAFQLANELYHSNSFFKGHFIEAWELLLNEQINENLWCQVENLDNHHGAICVFVTTYSFLKLLEAWNIEADYIVTDMRTSWVYAAFKKSMTLSDAFNLMINGSSTLSQEHNAPEEDENLLILNLFDCNHLTGQQAHFVDQYDLFNQKQNTWQDILGALKVINQKVSRIDWKLFELGYQRNKMILPTYPFERKQYWQSPLSERINLNLQNSHPLLTRQLNTPLAKYQFLANVSLETFSFLADHKIYEQILFPASGFVELISASLRNTKPGKAYEIRDFRLISPLIISQHRDHTLLVVIDEKSIVIYYLSNESHSTWVKLVIATYDWIEALETSDIEIKSDEMDLLQLPYADLKNKGVEYGPFFRSIKRLMKNEAGCFAEIQLNLSSDFSLLGLLDGALQAVGGFLLDEINHFSDAIYLPHSFEKLSLYHYPADKVLVKLKLVEKNVHYCLVNLFLYNSQGKLLISINHYRAEKVKKSRLQQYSHASSDPIYHTLGWTPVSLRTEANPCSMLACDFLPKNDLVIKNYGISVVNEFNLKSIPKVVDHIVFYIPLKTELEDLLEYYQSVLIQLQDHLNKISAIPHIKKSSWIFVLFNTATISDSAIDPVHSFFVGMVKSLRLEYPQRTIISVDFDYKESYSSIEGMIKSLPQDLALDFAYRNNILYQLTLTPYQPKQVIKNSQQDFRSILIFGGSSVISLSLVEELLANTDATLVLVARHARDIQTRFDSERVKLILGDVTNQAFVSYLVSHIKSNYPPLKTFIHAAGVLSDGMFASLSWSAMRDVISVKAMPLMYMNQACAENNVILDKVLVLSSVSTLSGGHGQVHYAGANAFMEGYMHLLRSKGISATAIALSPVTGSHMADSSLIVKRHPDIAITMSDAVSAISLALHVDIVPHIVTMNAYFIEQLKLHKNYHSLFSLQKKNDASIKLINSESIIHSLNDKSYSERITLVKNFLLQELGKVMQLRDNEFDENSGFFELGMDSLMAIELFDVIQQRLGDGVKLSSTLLFDIPNIAALTEYLVKAIFPNQRDSRHQEVNQASSRIDQLSDQDLLSEVDAILLSTMSEDIK